MASSAPGQAPIARVSAWSAPAMIGNKNGTKNGSKNKASKVRGAPADAPYSLAGSRFAKK